ncbi:MAG: DNA repair exonuclease, partial [Chloroflexi bacterium]|nr:DNA repair exonuclease [Chloroflexota bacterium]
MTRIRFVHAADLHLDSPFSGLRSIVPEIAQTLHQATFNAYDNIIDLCIREQVDALLVAGDIFDGADRSLRAQLKFADGLNRLEAANIRSFICHGNHDPLDGWEAKITLPGGCHRFGAELTQVPV